MTVRHLPVEVPAPGPLDHGAGPDHPMRLVTVAAAFEPGWWTPERAAEVHHLFDDLAPAWNSRDTPERPAPVLDALHRGGLPRGRWVEVGAGTGLGTRDLRAHAERYLAVDLSREMLRQLDPAWAPRVQADASRLPLPGGVADVVVLVNMLLFPAEVDRVLAPAGAVLWVNSHGDRTPIHLSAEQLDEALPGPWEVVASQAGHGTWAVARGAGAAPPPGR